MANCKKNDLFLPAKRKDRAPLVVGPVFDSNVEGGIHLVDNHRQIEGMPKVERRIIGNREVT